jgi:N-acetylmuramoyl-L-alanine amidase
VQRSGRARPRGSRRLYGVLVLAVGIGAGVLTAQLTASDDEAASRPSASAAGHASATRSQPPTTAATAAPIPLPAPLAGRTIALDPGHNRDNGRFSAEIGRRVDAGGFQKQCNTTGTATDAGVVESSVNWALAVELRARLEGLGARVVLTRAADAGWGPCVDQRAAAANAAGADLLLSLHADGAASADHGFHVILPGFRPGWTDDIAGPSRRAAVTVRDALVDAGFVPATYRGDQGLDERTDLGTLNRADVPAVMLEAGNLRNAQDAALLTDPAGRARLVEALAAAVRSFLLG